MNKGKFKQMFLSCLLGLLPLVLSGCTLSVEGPQYTQESLIETLKGYGVTAHYPIDQGTGQLLRNATGTHYLLQIDYIDQYEVPEGWTEVYLYPDAESAYQEALKVRQEFDEQLRYDRKMSQLQGRSLESAPLPLFQHGNVILYGGGITKQQDTMERITKTFETYQK
ncbi:hypothetical protein [Tumebacillus permanentifrigoris]|uniref:DUF4358 domain-containing protein n=1 Tax=Tumebacillus permanentifrigoris TaxID=378543 RepID=A0A316D865_9BACL|nr:hypothetical protein [Tumebacillus permanentifrigoris]PWK10251.1 hypothetical protein C7459_11272 [Tumebacillus permanentifrigoris]